MRKPPPLADLPQTPDLDLQECWTLPWIDEPFGNDLP